MTRRLPPVLLVCALLALPPSAAAQGDVEIRAVSAIAPLRDDNGTRARDVYRTLIPNGLEMPGEPAVGVWLADLAFVAGRGRPADDASHWLEGAVQIRVRRGDVEGWYPIHYPVTAEFWFNAGRYVGLPKRHATAAIEPDGEGWSAFATPRDTTGEPSYRMDWQPSPGQDTSAFGVPSEPLLVLNKPLEGPDLMRVQYTLGAPGFVVPGGPEGLDPEDPNPDSGLVHLRVRDDLDALQEADLPRIFLPGTSLGDLIETDQVVPGIHAYRTVSLGSESEKIGEGGYDENRQAPPRGGGEGAPAPPPSQRGGPSGDRDRPARRCRTARTLRLRFRAIPGARIKAVSVRVDGRRVGVKRLRGKRVRFRVRGAGRHRIVIVARQARGFRTKTKRVVRLCAR